MDKDYLYNEYWKNKKTMVDIAKAVSKDPKTIHYWMRKYNIPTRPRGSNTKVHFKKGQQTRLGIKHTENTKMIISKKSKGKKPYLRNGKHWLHDEKSVNPNWKGGITPERQTLYRSNEWKDAVKKVFEKYDYTCQKCGIRQGNGNGRIQFHIHHIEDFSNVEKRTEISNLVLLCRKCHYWVHSKENINKEFIMEKEVKEAVDIQ